MGKKLLCDDVAILDKQSRCRAPHGNREGSAQRLLRDLPPLVLLVEWAGAWVAPLLRDGEADEEGAAGRGAEALDSPGVIRGLP